MGFPGGTSGKEPACQCRRRKRRSFDPWVGKMALEEGMANHSSIRAWKIQQTEEPGGLQSKRLQSQASLKCQYEGTLPHIFMEPEKSHVYRQQTKEDQWYGLKAWEPESRRCRFQVQPEGLRTSNDEGRRR